MTTNTTPPTRKLRKLALPGKFATEFCSAKLATPFYAALLGREARG